MTVPTLARAMREGSRAEHVAAESAPFVADVMTGAVAPATYALYLARLREVYVALEDAVAAHRDRPELASLYDDRLLRLGAIDADLAHWATHAARDAAARSPAVAAYVDRIERATDWPELLVAHHYTRYLGDLSGGRILARRLCDAFGPGAALAFYDFPHIEKPETYKRAYRDALDALPLDTWQRRRVVREVRAAFRLNRALLEELPAA